MYKLIIIPLLLLSSQIFSQAGNDSLNNNYNNIDILKLNTLKTDWIIINSPLLFYPMNTFSSSHSNNLSLYSLYTNSQINTAINFELQPDVMLKRFQLVNNWEAKKEYGVFAKYLGIAQFVGAVGLAAVHISKYHISPKEKAKLKGSKVKKP
ncbi:MAG: hypothetical protein L3J41_09260 [Melioribacteraceae bacterium]|nr:hypothetical protein [Melioribacteraceae bacterium]